MLIKQLELLNFQSHKKTVIQFSKYLNAIIGSSRAGKSAILRSIFQTFNNEIKWEHCRRWDTDKTSIKITGDDHTIVRVNGDGVNSLTVDGHKEDFIGSSTPEHLAKITNIASHNFQRQDELFFMINMKPGLLSKAMNDVSGLSIIDNTIKEAAQRIRDTQAEIRVNNIRLTNIKMEIDDMEFITTADQEYSVIEDLMEEVSVYKRKYAELSNLYSKMSSLSKEAKIIEKRIDGVDLSIIKDKIDTLHKYQHDYDLISVLYDSYTKDKSKLDSLSFSEDHKKIGLLLSKLNEDKEEYKVINAYRGALRTGQKELTDSLERIAEYESMLKNIKLCPTCKRPL